MNFDELIVCTRCESDACYKQEVTKDISIELCYGCGFQSNSLMKKGTIFAYGASRDNWQWAAAKAIPDDEKGFITNMSNLKLFKESDFIEALSYIEVIP